MDRRGSRHRAAENGQRLPRQATQVRGAQVRAAEGDAGYVAQARAFHRIDMRAAHRSGAERRLHFCQMRGIAVFQHQLPRPVGSDADDAVGDDADDPHAAFGVEGESVRKRAGTEFGNRFPPAQGAVGADGKARQTARESLVHVEITAIGTWQGLVGVAQAIGDDARITATATLPLYQGGAEWASIRQAKERNNAARLDVEDARRATDQSVSNAWESYRAAKALSEANRQQVKAAEIAFEGVQQELEVGSRTTLDVLDQQQELLNARVALVRSERDEIVASYALLGTVGKLTAKELQLPVQLYDPVENYEMQTWRPVGAATYGD